MQLANQVNTWVTSVIQKMGPKVNDDKVDHGQIKYKNHDILK
jgi:hypothetical protein